MLQMCWEIRIGRFRLGLLDGVKIHRSVDLLSDTAVITLPATLMNKTLRLEDWLKRGQNVEIRLGYNQNMRTEFTGYLLEIGVEKSNMILKCEDSFFLLRKSLPDKELKLLTLKQLLEYVIRGTGVEMELDCTYDYVFDKYVISKMTGYDILGKLQDETKANIYVKGNTLHVHPAYEEVFGQVKYDFAINIEKDSLVYRKAEDRKYELEVEGNGKDGSCVKVTVGTVGADKRSLKVSSTTDPETLKKRGEEELKRLTYDGYDGDLTGWLIPYCDAGYVAEITDEAYPEKNGLYYVTAVTTEFNQNGGSRKVQLGRKMESHG